MTYLAPSDPYGSSVRRAIYARTIAGYASRVQPISRASSRASRGHAELCMTPKRNAKQLDPQCCTIDGNRRVPGNSTQRIRAPRRDDHRSRDRSGRSLQRCAPIQVERGELQCTAARGRAARARPADGSAGEPAQTSLLHAADAHAKSLRRQPPVDGTGSVNRRSRARHPPARSSTAATRALTEPAYRLKRQASPEPGKIMQKNSV